MTTLAFTKMHGLGNDFVVIDGRARMPAVGVAETRAIGDRRTGVGFDQLLILEPPVNGAADVFMRIRNPDGSEAEACGNGTRCVAAMVMAETGAGEVNIETVAGVLHAKTESDGRVTVDMGPAVTAWREIPLAEEIDTLHLGIEAGGLADPVGVGVGNPHMVFFVDDVDAVALETVGPVLETHPLYPERTNVEIVQVIGEDRLRMRVWERAAGITRACGSGACAVVVAAHRRGLSGRAVEVVLDGGPLGITWSEDNRLLMTGPVATSFAGTFAPGLLD